MPHDADVPHALVFFSACCAIAELRFAPTGRNVAPTGHSGEWLHANGVGSFVSHRSQKLRKTNHA